MVDQVNADTQNQDQNAQNQQSLGWRAALPDEYKEHEFVKTFQKPGDFVKSALDIKTEHDSLKTKLASAIIKPGENATPEEKAAYHKALGVPDKPEEYEFPKVEGVEHDEKMLSWARDVFHKNGLNKEQAAGISQAWDGFIKGIEQGLQEAETNALKEVETKLKEEWKADYDKNFELSKRAFKKFSGAELSDFKAHPTLVKAFYEVGKAMGEDTSPAGPQTGASPPTVGMNYNMPKFGG